MEVTQNYGQWEDDQMMMAFIWMFQVSKKVLVQILLLNFLISLVIKLHTEQESNKTNVTYLNKNSLNYDCLLVLNYFGIHKQMTAQIMYSEDE